MSHLDLYNAVRSVPSNAKKTIAAGKLKGKTDINPVWRIKTLTEQFGPCGIGWGYCIDKLWHLPAANGEVAAFCDITLWYIQDGKRGEIPGTGGSMLVDTQKGKLTTNDDAFKMALTDAISVAAKALGVAADVYWEADTTKYSKQQDQPSEIVCPVCKKPIKPFEYKGELRTPEAQLQAMGMCLACHKKKAAEQ